MDDKFKIIRAELGQIGDQIKVLRNSARIGDPGYIQALDSIRSVAIDAMQRGVRLEGPAWGDDDLLMWIKNRCDGVLGIIK